MSTTLNLTVAQRHLLRIQADDEKALLSAQAMLMPVIAGYDYVWSLPDDELRDVLQELYDTPAPSQFGNELNRLLFRHYTAASGLNAILDMGGRPGQRASVTKPRDWSVVDGRIELVPLPEPTTPPDEQEP